MPVFNGEKYLADAIQSVLNQSFTKWELLIVDDGSRDKSAGIASEYCARDAQRLKLLRHPGKANLGAAASRNLAILNSCGFYLAFIDADDIWHIDKLHKQIEFMKSKPQLALSYTYAAIISEDNNISFLPGLKQYGSDLPGNRDEALIAIASGQAHFAFSSTVATRDSVTSAGLFRIGLNYQNEDRLLVSMIAANHQVELYPELLCGYRVHPGNYTSSNSGQHRAAMLFLDIQARLLLWNMTLPGHPAWRDALKKNFLSNYSSHRFLAALHAPLYRNEALHILGCIFKASPALGLRLIFALTLSATCRRRQHDRERSAAEMLSACSILIERLKADGISNIVLYGAGTHTERILQSGCLSGINITAILDDNPRVSSLHGIPVLIPDAISLEKDTAVVISSDTKQDIIRRRAVETGLNPFYCLY